jgi:hypothetical protein
MSLSFALLNKVKEVKTEETKPRSFLLLLETRLVLRYNNIIRKQILKRL